MKYKRCNLEKMPDAINEYNNTKQTHKEICEKYDININSFFYYLKKNRIASIEMSHRGLDAEQNPASRSRIDETFKNSRVTQKIKPQKGSSLQNSENTNILSEIDGEGNKLVSFNTTSKKMKEYMKQHNVQVINNTTTLPLSSCSENIGETPCTGGNTIKKRSKKQPERVDLNKIYEGYL